MKLSLEGLTQLYSQSTMGAGLRNLVNFLKEVKTRLDAVTGSGALVAENSPTLNSPVLNGGMNFGDQSVNGSWKIERSGVDLNFYRKDSGAWVAKVSFADGTVADQYWVWSVSLNRWVVAYRKAAGPVSVVDANASPSSKDGVVVCDSATAITVSLPAAVGSGYTIYVANVNTGVVKIDGNVDETINGSAAEYLYQGDAMVLVDYATGKWVIL